MSNPKLLVLIPCRDSIRSNAFPNLSGAVIQAERFWRDHVGSSDFGIRTLPGVQAAEARTVLWKYAQASNAEWTLWFDDDTCPPFDVLEKLWGGTPLGDIVTGFYWRKGPPYESVVARFSADRGITWIDPSDMSLPYEEIEGCGFGCVLVRRKVLDHVGLEYNDLPFLTKPGQTEDIYFCNAARRLGYRVIAARDVQCGHVGDYTYSYADRQRWLRENPQAKAKLEPVGERRGSGDEVPQIRSATP